MILGDVRLSSFTYYNSSVLTTYIDLISVSHGTSHGKGSTPSPLSHDLQIHELASGELLEGGQVRWEDGNEQQVSPDYLMFHPDDSNKVIHIRTSKLR